MSRDTRNYPASEFINPIIVFRTQNDVDTEFLRRAFKSLKHAPIINSNDFDVSIEFIRCNTREKQYAKQK